MIPPAATPNEPLKPDGCLGSSWPSPASPRATGLRSRRAKGGWGRAGFCLRAPGALGPDPGAPPFGRRPQPPQRRASFDPRPCVPKAAARLAGVELAFACEPGALASDPGRRPSGVDPCRPPKKGILDRGPWVPGAAEFQQTAHSEGTHSGGRRWQESIHIRSFLRTSPHWTIASPRRNPKRPAPNGIVRHVLRPSSSMSLAHQCCGGIRRLTAKTTARRACHGGV